MTHGSLFSGIGGFDLAAEWMGWENIFHCEWMPFPRQVLHYHFPNSISYEDITKTNFTVHRGSIDILTGGFPCQPYSSAGKRLGKEDERHLWPHMLRAIQEIEPTYVVGENVRGLTNWNGGVVFEEVCADLENCGYEVQPILLPACAIGAPHRRDRVWFIATNTKRIRLQHTTQGRNLEQCESKTRRERSEFAESIKTNGSIGDVTNTNSIRQHQCECDNAEQSSERGKYALNDFNENDGQGDVTDTDCTNNQTFTQERLLGQKNSIQTTGRFINGHSRLQWDEFPTQSPVCGGDDGIPTKLDGITFSKWRQESIKGYGNAIVPQLAYEIFKVIQTMHDAIPR
jgi:DNA (cytosine-5)-methyltransferase 1